MYNLKATILLLGLAVAGLATPIDHEGINGLVERKDCDCKAFKKCNANCGVFNNGSGQGGGFCTIGCYDATGCSGRLCCQDGTSCKGKGCCEGHSTKIQEMSVS